MKKNDNVVTRPSRKRDPEKMGKAMTPETMPDKIKKAAKLLWRHAFTLFILSFILHGIFKGYTLQGENACGFLLGAILLDWYKQFMKPASNAGQHYHHSESQAIYRDDDGSNPYVIGTPAYLRRNSDNRYN
jgi:hypothetical protein